MINLFASALTLGLAIGIQIAIREESPHLYELDLLMEYTYYNLVTVLLVTLAVLLMIVEYDGDDSK